MSIALANAPIDEVFVGFVLDNSDGPDAVEVGEYFAQRRDRYARHEMHEPLVSSPAISAGAGSVRVWLVGNDDAWMVQLQPGRFYANWRRRKGAAYPGFSKENGVMRFALDELASWCAFLSKIRAAAVRPVAVELSKIDLLVQGKHWSDVDDAAKLLPVLTGLHRAMQTPGFNAAAHWRDGLEDGTVVEVSLQPARLKANLNVLTYRAEFSASSTVGEDLEASLRRLSRHANDAFERLVPAAERKRFA